MIFRFGPDDLAELRSIHDEISAEAGLALDDSGGIIVADVAALIRGRAKIEAWWAGRTEPAAG